MRISPVNDEEPILGQSAMDFYLNNSSHSRTCRRIHSWRFKDLFGL